MDDVVAFFIAFEDIFNLIGLLAFAGSGTLIGGIVGIVVIITLQKAGLLGRRVRWHHYLLKTYFLLLPICAGILGAQAATVYGMQTQLHRTVEAFRPDVRVWSEQAWNQYVHQMDAEEASELLNNVEEFGAMGTAELLVDAFLDKQGLVAEGSTVPTTVSERAVSMAIAFLQSRTIRNHLINAITAEVAKMSGASEETVHFVLTKPVREILSGDVLIDLLMKKIDAQFLFLYLMVFFQLVLIVLLLAVEMLISRYFGFSASVNGGCGEAVAQVA